MNLPKVSCICPTFCRVYLLEEAIESFLRQDYAGEKELIVCSDFLPQELVYEHPSVKIINLSERAPNLGAKRNATYAHATGDLLLTWGDDDIHLPGRISRMVNKLQDKEFLYEGQYYVLYGGKLYWERGKTSGAHIITKRLFDELGGIPEMNSGEDQAFNTLVKNKMGEMHTCTEPPQFLYRYSTGRAHVSQFGNDKPDKRSGYDRVFDSAMQYITTGIEPKGKIQLQPKWSKDWVEEVKHAIKK